MWTHRVIVGLVCLMMGKPIPVISGEPVARGMVFSSSMKDRNSGLFDRVLTHHETYPFLADMTHPRIPSATTALDIMLTDMGQMEGSVILASGDAAGNVPIVVRNAVQNTQHAAQLEMEVSTDTSGRFSIGPLSSGVYVVMLADRIFIVRAWRRGTAPPAARDHAIFTLPDIARGQLPVSTFFKSDRFLLVSSIIVAIGIPAAVYANRHDGQPGS